jgi:hypothetical protein
MKRAARDALTYIRSFGAAPARRSRSGVDMSATPPPAIAQNPSLLELWRRQEFLARQQQELGRRVDALERRVPTEAP